MYAVFKTGGKQYRASQGDKLKIEKLDAEAGAKVTGKVVAQDRHDKISVIKFKRRTTYKRMHGHRQAFTLVEITNIAAGA